jgi:hypothetical protein
MKENERLPAGSAQSEKTGHLVDFGYFACYTGNL